MPENKNNEAELQLHKDASIVQDNQPEGLVFSHIGLARVRGTVVANPTPGVTASFTGPLDTNAGLIPLAYIKDLTPRELLGELIGSYIGKQLGLPLPDAFLAIATKEQGPWANAPMVDENNSRILFATSAVQSPQTLFFYTQKPDENILRKLIEWPFYAQAVAFDEWIANIDRHGGNILISGDRKFWLIDHSHILTGNTWSVATLTTMASMAFVNQLPTYTKTIMTPEEKAERVLSAKAACAEHVKIQIAALLDSYPFDLFLPSSERDAVSSFLIGRQNYTCSLVENRLC